MAQNTEPVPMLDHERLDVYAAARELSREICQVRKKIGKGRSDMVDQLLRTTGSVPLNIAEGSGERMAGRRAYFYRIARSAATEVGAALDHLVDMELLQANETIRAKRVVVPIVAMLVRLTDRTALTPESFPPLPRRRQPRKRQARTRTRARARTRPFRRSQVRSAKARRRPGRSVNVSTTSNSRRKPA